MGRGCTMDEWVHFEKLPEEGRVPNSSYWYVICRHCLRGYEQKQLPSFPARLTGRRSAMRGHLKNCPIYGAQYKAEQQLLGASENSDTHNTQSSVAAAVAAAAAAATTNAPIAVALASASAATAALATPAAPNAAATATNVVTDPTATALATANAVKATAPTAPGAAPVAPNGEPASQPLTVPAPAQAATGDASSAPTTATPTPVATPTGPVVEQRRKRKSEGGRGKHCMMEEWEHFIRLQEEGYIGKSNFFQVICRHCQEAYDKAVAENKAADLMPPERLVGRREKMRKHLTLCPNFKGELPPLERRVTLNSAIIASLSSHHSNASRPSSSESMDATGAQDAGAPGGQLRVSESSRLALDEWQFFTRLHRKKDSAYHFARCNFCQMAYDRAPESLKKSMEPTIVMGRKSNMQTHLAKCPHIPKNAQLLTTTTASAFSPAASACSSTSASGSATGYAAALSLATTSDVVAGVTANKKAELTATFGLKRDAPTADINGKALKRIRAVPHLTDLSNWHLSLLSFTAHFQLSFDWLDQPPTRDLFAQLFARESDAENHTNASLVASLLPDAATFRSSLLASLSGELEQKLLAKWKESVVALSATAAAVDASSPAITAPFLSMLVTSRQQVPKMNSIECLVSNGAGLKLPYSKLMNSSKCEKGSSTAEIVSRAFSNWCSPEGVQTPRAVVLPLGADFDGVKRALKEVGQPIFVLHDFQQVLVLLLYEILRLDTTKQSLQILFEAFEAKKEKLEVLFPHCQLADPRKSLRGCVDTLQQVVDVKQMDLLEDQLSGDAKLHQTLWQNMRALNQVLGILLPLVLAVEQSHWSVAQVLDGFGQLYEATQSEEEPGHTNSILKEFRDLLENAWARFEHPLHVTSYLLDPRFRLHRVNHEAVKKCFDLSEAGEQYYAVVKNKRSVGIRAAIQALEQQSFSLDVASSGDVSVLTTELEAIETSCGSLHSSTRALEKLMVRNGELGVQQTQQVALLMDCQVGHNGRSVVDEITYSGQMTATGKAVDQWTACIEEWLESVGGDAKWLRQDEGAGATAEATPPQTTEEMDTAEDTEETEDENDEKECKSDSEKSKSSALTAAQQDHREEGKSAAEDTDSTWGAIETLRRKKIRLEHLIARPLHHEVTI